MISPDHIASICNPLEWVKESYENRMKGDDPNAYGEPVGDESMIDTTLDSIEVTGELLNE